MKKNNSLFFSLLISLVLVVFFSLSFGVAEIGVKEVIEIILSKTFIFESFFDSNVSNNIETIIINLRLPRILLGVAVGASLSLAGSTMQGLFKNPLADPYIIGLSSGAAFGAALAILFFPSLSFLKLPIFSFVTGLFTIFLVYHVAKENNVVPTNKLLLAGIAFNFLLSALTSFLMYFSEERIHQIMFWILGGLTGARWEHVYIITPFVIFFGIFTTLNGDYLDSIMIGEEKAKTIGVDVEKKKTMFLIISSLVTALAVSFSGIIGFIGLIPPHVIRIIKGPKHRVLIPSATLLGAITLVASDTVARTLIAPTEIPVGIITSILGAPFFIYLVWRK